MTVIGGNMIRDFTHLDLNEIIRIYTLEYQAMPDEIETLKAASKILVYEEQGAILGFVHLDINGEKCYMEMGIACDEQVIAIGLKLWDEVKKVIAENDIHSITTFHVKENQYWLQLFDQIGLEYWYSVYRFCYRGPKFVEPILNVVQYEDRYFEDKIRLESEAFSVLREENDIKPYNWYLGASKEALDHNRKRTLSNKAYTYLFFEADEMVGASMVKNAELDLLFVNVKFQGKGYGKKLLEFTVNKGLEQNAEGVSLNALASNEMALKLYTNAGFKILQAQDCRQIKF